MFSKKEIKKINEIVDQRLREKALDWKIVRVLPEVMSPNTLYFLQVSINPRRFELFHTDKDADVASIDTSTGSNLNGGY